MLVHQQIGLETACYAKVHIAKTVRTQANIALLRSPEPLPMPARGQAYRLTPWGQAAEPLIQELGRWAAQSSAHNPRLPLSPVSLMLSLRTMMDPDKCERMPPLKIGFVIGDEQFLAELAGRAVPIRRARPDEADAGFCAPDAAVLAGGIYAGVCWDTLEHDAGLVIEGDRELALRFADLFQLPPRLA